MATYSVKDLEKLYEKNEKRMRLGKPMLVDDMYLTTAAGHTLDLIEIAKYAKDCRLDLTADTFANIHKALFLLGMKNLKAKGMSKEEIVDDLIKKAASYEMFLLCNILDDGTESACAITLPAGKTELELMAKNLITRAEASINLYEAYRRTQETKGIFKVLSSGAISIYEGLATQIVTQEFFAPLGFEE